MLYRAKALPVLEPEIRNNLKVIQVFGRLEIIHEDYLGKQIVYCRPFKSMKADSDVSSTRTDYVSSSFIPPPPFFTGRRADFHLSLDDAWYGRVTLLFRMQFRHDSGEIREVECAMIDVFKLYNYADERYCTKRAQI
jgi:hypothetical protein